MPSNNVTRKPKKPHIPTLTISTDMEVDTRDNNLIREIRNEAAEEWETRAKPCDWLPAGSGDIGNFIMMYRKTTDLAKKEIQVSV